MWFKKKTIFPKIIKRTEEYRITDSVIPFMLSQSFKLPEDTEISFVQNNERSHVLSIRITAKNPKDVILDIKEQAQEWRERNGKDGYFMITEAEADALRNLRAGCYHQNNRLYISDRWYIDLERPEYSFDQMYKARVRGANIINSNYGTETERSALDMTDESNERLVREIIAEIVKKYEAQKAEDEKKLRQQFQEDLIKFKESI